MTPRRPDRMIDYSNLAPEVGDVLRDDLARQAQRRMTRKQLRDAARTKVTIDLPDDLRRNLDQIADRLSVPLSQVYRWLLLRGLEVTSIDELEAYRISSRSMRYEFVLFRDDASPKRQP